MSYCENQNAAVNVRIGLLLKKDFKTKIKTKSELKKSARKSTTRDERSSDIYRLNPWKDRREDSNQLSALMNSQDFQKSRKKM